MPPLPGSRTLTSGSTATPRSPSTSALLGVALHRPGHLLPAEEQTFPTRACHGGRVQKMVNGRAAGVAMTLNPTNGDRSKITIDASYGRRGNGRLGPRSPRTTSSRTRSSWTSSPNTSGPSTSSSSRIRHQRTASSVQVSDERRAGAACQTRIWPGRPACQACREALRLPAGHRVGARCRLPTGGNLLRSRPARRPCTRPRPRVKPAGGGYESSLGLGRLQLSSITSSLLNTAS